MKIQKIILNAICALSLLFLTSCLTKAVWGDKSYDERITQFFVGTDGRYVVLIGDSFHYILTDNSRMLKEILSLKQQGVLSINYDKTNIKLDSNNDLEGDLVIEGPFSVLPIEDVGSLQHFGIRPDKNDIISIKISISGRRYAARYLGQNFPAPNSIQKIRIHYSDSNLVKGLGKAAITPVTVTLDAIILIGKAVVYPLDHWGN